MKRGETLVVLALMGGGLAWSWLGSAYGLRLPEGRVAVTLVGFVGSFLLMWIGLAASGVSRAGRASAAVLAILPWNGVLLSQLAYVGYMFIPLEVLASGLLLARRTHLPRRHAFALATLIRIAAFLLTLAAAAGIRRWLAR